MSVIFQRERLHTVQVVPLTAFDANDRLNIEPMQQLVRRLYEAGVRVFIPCAGSSEFHSLSADEIVTSIGAARAAAGEDATIVAPVGLQIHHALDVGERSLAEGADCVMVMPLAFPYVSNAGARDYYEAIFQRLNCPTLIYKKSDIPSDHLLLDLADAPQFVGVKYSVNNLDAFSQTVQQGKDRVDWFCGSAERFSPFFGLAGAPGYTSGAANICPRVTLAMHAAMQRGDWSEAFRLQRIILPIENYRAREGNAYNVTFLKYAISRTGLDFGQPRPPYRRLTAAEMAEIDALLPPILAAEAELG